MLQENSLPLSEKLCYILDTVIIPRNPCIRFLKPKTNCLSVRQTHLCETYVDFLICGNTGHKKVKGYLGTDYTICLDSHTTWRLADIIKMSVFNVNCLLSWTLIGAAVFSYTEIFYPWRKLSILFLFNSYLPWHPYIHPCGLSNSYF